MLHGWVYLRADTGWWVADLWWIRGNGGAFRLTKGRLVGGDRAQQAGLVWFREYDLGVELESLELDGGTPISPGLCCCLRSQTEVTLRRDF